MIISHSKKFIIFAPWKTASSTLHARLATYSEGPYSRFYDYNPHLQRVVHQHITCADFAALPESRLGYFTASFVRNPYDRVYSGFQQIQSALESQPKEAYPEPWIRALVMKALSANFAQICEAGFDFDAWVALLREEQIFETGHNVSFPLYPAHYWTHVNGAQAVNFIGRVEYFEDDFNALCGHIGIEPTTRLNVNVNTEPTDLAPGNYRYIGAMSPASIARINHLFARDFELLDYRPIG